MSKKSAAEAMRNDGEIGTISAILDWVNGGRGQSGPATYELTGNPRLSIIIEVGTGIIRADVGGYVIKLPSGEFRTCGPAEFAKNYSEVQTPGTTK